MHVLHDDGSTWSLYVAISKPANDNPAYDHAFIKSMQIFRLIRRSRRRPLFGYASPSIHPFIPATSDGTLLHLMEFMMDRSHLTLITQTTLAHLPNLLATPKFFQIFQGGSSSPTSPSILSLATLMAYTIVMFISQAHQGGCDAAKPHATHGFKDVAKDDDAKILTPFTSLPFAFAHLERECWCTR